jgi:hypothetical protein
VQLPDGSEPNPVLHEEQTGPSEQDKQFEIDLHKKQTFIKDAKFCIKLQAVKFLTYPALQLEQTGPFEQVWQLVIKLHLKQVVIREA